MDSVVGPGFIPPNYMLPDTNIASAHGLLFIDQLNMWVYSLQIGVMMKHVDQFSLATKGFHHYFLFVFFFFSDQVMMVFLLSGVILPFFLFIISQILSQLCFPSIRSVCFCHISSDLVAFELS